MNRYNPYTGTLKNVEDVSGIPVVVRYPTIEELMDRFKMSREEAQIVVSRQGRTSRRSGTRTADS